MNVRWKPVTSLISVGLAVVSVAGCATPTLVVSESITVYLLPLGPVPESQMQAAAAEVRTFNYRPVLLEPVPLENSLGDLERRQLIAEKVTTRVHAAAHELSLQNERPIFAITQADLFVGQKPRSPFSFAYGAPDQTVTLISTARMNPLGYGKPADETLLNTRLRKFVSRYLTYLTLRGGGTNNPKCVTYGPMNGVADIDRLGTTRC